MCAPCYGFHETKRIESGRLYHEKGNREIHWFDGAVEVCTRKGCNYEKFIGKPVAYAREMVQAPREDQRMVHL